MTKKQLNNIKNILIGTETTLHGISETVREIIDCYDPLDFNGENDLLNNSDISFEWKNEDKITEGINVIFEIVDNNLVKVTDIDTF